MIRLVENSIQELSTVKALLMAIDPEMYTRPIEQMSNATIGQHIRHIIEFYQCLLQQAESQIINYCLRERDLKIESDRQIAIAAIDDLCRDLPNLKTSLRIVLQTNKNGDQSINSNLERELFYNIEHCIHHMAMIKIGLQLIAPHTEVPANFGIAPSTIQHRKTLLQAK